MVSIGAPQRTISLGWYDRSDLDSLGVLTLEKVRLGVGKTHKCFPLLGNKYEAGQEIASAAH